MKNATIGKITTSKSTLPSARFDLSHDVNTTCAWTDIQPLMCRAMQPDSKATVSLESLVRLAPMVAPTFGDARFRTWHEFVAMSDLTRNYDALMSQTRVNRGGLSFTPTVLPSCTLFELSCLTLIGSSMTIYQCPEGANFDVSHPWSAYETLDSCDALLNNLAGDSGETLNDIYNLGPFLGENAFEGADDFFRFNPTILLRESLSHNRVRNRDSIFIPVNRGKAAANPTSAFKLSVGVSSTAQLRGGDVTLEGADIIIFREFNPHGFAFAFRLSDMGKRIRKALIGAGYQINFDSSQRVSLMPLLALHKAWYELFAPQLFENYEDTAANAILQRFDNNNEYEYTFNSSVAYRDNLFYKFALELGSMWYTEKADFVNAHTVSMTPNPKTFDLSTFYDVAGTSDSIGAASTQVGQPASSDPETNQNNAHFRTLTMNHGALDCELLKKLYKWTNRNSIAGQRVRDLLIQQGLADYVDECAPRFIGYQDTHIQISDVVSDADTFNASEDSGALLGEYSGRGLQYVEGKSFSYEAKEYGFWICLCSVVPKCGYAQALDANVCTYDKVSSYQPEFDGLSVDFDRKLLVCADSPVSNPKVPANGTLDASFGAIPRYSSLKIANNKMNGDFSLRSSRSNYEPYTLDRLFAINDKSFNTVVVDGVRRTTVGERFPVTAFPVAGNIWKYIARYPFLSNPNRIFANVGGINRRFVAESEQMNFNWELGITQSDNFLVHNVIHMDYYAHMLPIEDSFETHDEGNDGKTNSSIEKA